MSPTARVLALFGGLILIVPGLCIIRSEGPDVIVVGSVFIGAGVLLIVLGLWQRRK